MGVLKCLSEVVVAANVRKRRSVMETNATKRGSGSCCDSTSPLGGRRVSGRGISTRCLKRGIATAGRQLLV
jgi:hypothetical protein